MNTEVPAVRDADRVLTEMVEPRRRFLHIPLRTAAERANMSEGTWRQLVSGGVMNLGRRVPRHPRRDQVLSMANAVGVLDHAAEELHATPDEVENARLTANILDPAENEIMRAKYLKPREKLKLIEQLADLRREA